MNDRQKSVLVHAINHFGVEANIDKALEEMGELTTELSRRRLSRYDKDKVAEEIADVLITVEKLRIIFGASKVDGCVAEKLERLEDTINGDWRRQERMMPKGMVKHREESEARKGSLVEECVEAGLMAGLKSIDPDLAEKVAKAPAVLIPANDVRERAAAVATDRKRQTVGGDPVVAAFHGEVWCKCRLCGKKYELQSGVRRDPSGLCYCPRCNGYGKEEGSHE